MHAAGLHIIATGELALRQAKAMLSLCEAHDWKAVSVSRSIPALAALVAIGAVDVVILARRDREAVQTIELAGGRVAFLREPRRQSARGEAGLADALAALVAAGRLSQPEAAALLNAAGMPDTGRPDRIDRRPKRSA